MICFFFICFQGLFRKFSSQPNVNAIENITFNIAQEVLLIYCTFISCICAIVQQPLSHGKIRDKCYVFIECILYGNAVKARETLINDIYIHTPL